MKEESIKFDSFLSWRDEVTARGYGFKRVTKSKHNTYYQAIDSRGAIVGFFNDFLVSDPQKRTPGGSINNSNDDPTPPVPADISDAIEHRKEIVKLEQDIIYLRGALKMIQEDASRPFDKTRQQMCKVLAERALEKTKQYEGK